MMKMILSELESLQTHCTNITQPEIQTVAPTPIPFKHNSMQENSVQSFISVETNRNKVIYRHYSMSDFESK